MTQRKIAQAVTGRATIDGAGVHLVRVLGNTTVKTYDPFLMLDAFDSTNPQDYIRGFPMHPHRGIETFTYLIKGEMEHEDSLGHKGSIHNNSCQWMTAGSGILHQEMPLATDHMLGLQLWINLPAAHKMTEPKYRDITADQVPVVEEESATVRIVAGEYDMLNTVLKGAAQGDYVPIRFLDVTLFPEKTWEVSTRPEDTVFAYLMQGTCTLDGEELKTRHAVLFTPGDSLRLTGGPEGAHFVLVSGKPLHEPVAWGGPIVMNTEAELREAFQELEEESFLRHARPF